MATDTMDTTTKEKLFETFEKPTTEQWKAAAIETLKGAPFDKKLLTATPEGITVQPIYTAADVASATEAFPGVGNYTRGAAASGTIAEGWAVAQEIPCGTPAEFNAVITEDLGRGQTALNIVTDVATQKGLDADEAGVGEVGACGLSLGTLTDLNTAFEGVVWSAIPTYWQSGLAGLPLVALWAAHLKAKKTNLKEIRGAMDMDPLGVYLRVGTLPTSVEKAIDELAAAIRWGQKEMPLVAMLGVNGGIIAEAGGNAVQELANVAAATVAYIKELTARGLPAKEIFASMRWSFAVGGNFFMELAKIRAARVLWSNLATAYGVTGIAPRLHARTGLYNKTVYDAHNNILRASTEAFAAALGGVESLHVGPFDEILRTPDTFSRRIARNAQTILREEVGLAGVIDPAGGSYAVESLTTQLAGLAWEKFQCIQKAGGFIQAITEGDTQKFVAANAAERAKKFSQRREVLVGTNLYAVAKETPNRGTTTDYESIRAARAHALQAAKATSHPKLENLSTAKGAALVEAAIAAATSGATLGQITKALRAGATAAPTIVALKSTRLAMPYEALRATAHHVQPKVFLATMGNAKQHKARSDFITSFCEAGGIEVLYTGGFANAADAATAFAKSGAKLAVICSTDETYPTLVPEVTAAIKAVSASALVYLAGQPAPENEAAYKTAGMDSFISIKSNHLETLTTIINLYK